MTNTPGCSGNTKVFNLNRFYDVIAPYYSAAIGLLPMWQRYTEAVLPWIDRDGKILEIGPGPGWLLAKFAERRSWAAGLDLSAGMLEQTRKRLHQAGTPIRLCRGNLLRLPFRSNSLDAVATTFTLSAIADGNQAVKEMARVLRQPGGILALVDAGYPSDGNLLGTGLARLWELGGDFMRDERELMQQAGLKVIHRREFGAFKSIRIVIGQKLTS